MDEVYSTEREMRFDNVTGTNFLEYRPSCTAAAAVLCAANEIPSLTSLVNFENAESWCEGLIKVS